jgi:hypothetical protein
MLPTGRLDPSRREARRVCRRSRVDADQKEEDPGEAKGLERPVLERQLLRRTAAPAFHRELDGEHGKHEGDDGELEPDEVPSAGCNGRTPTGSKP